MIRIGLVGISAGNGHPYSFSAILNGYEPEVLAASPYPTILEYLGRQAPEAFGVDEARVTHIWAADKPAAQHVARACRIPHVVDGYEELLGQVDAVILPHDESPLHLPMARPFIRAGIPTFIDKPLADTRADLGALTDLIGEEGVVMSCSALRYSRELGELKAALPQLGSVSSVHGMSWRSWSKYGVHLVEAVHAVFGGGITRVRNLGRGERAVVHFRYNAGPDVLLDVGAPLPPMIRLSVYGTQGHRVVDFADWFTMFKETLSEFITMVKTRIPPIPIRDTWEIIAVVLAAQRSAERAGEPVPVEGAPS